MPLDKSGNFRMNPQQAGIMGDKPAAPPVADPAATPSQTVTITGQAGGPYQVTTDSGDGQPPKDASAPDFATAMQQAQDAFGEGGPDADDAGAAATPGASPGGGSSEY